MRKLFAVLMVLMLAACSQGMKGAYVDEMGVSRYVFHSGGKVRVEVMGVAQESTYQREGEAVRIKLPQSEATLDFTLDDDGSLNGPMGVRLIKVVE